MLARLSKSGRRFVGALCVVGREREIVVEMNMIDVMRTKDKDKDTRTVVLSFRGSSTYRTIACPLVV